MRSAPLEIARNSSITGRASPTEIEKPTLWLPCRGAGEHGGIDADHLSARVHQWSTELPELIAASV